MENLWLYMMDNPWLTSENLWVIYGKSMVTLWLYNGYIMKSMEHLWKIYG